MAMPDLTARQRELLAELAEVSPETATGLARGLLRSPSATRSALKRLKARGLVWSDNYQLKAAVWGPTPEGERAALAEEAT